MEPVTDLTPERIYERRWAQTLLDKALSRLRQEFAAAGKQTSYDILKSFLSRDSGLKSYSAAAAELGITTDAVGVAIHRFRQRYRHLVRDEIAHTVVDTAEVEDELRWLSATLS